METILVIFFATLSFSFGIAYWTTFNDLKKSNFVVTELFIKNRALEEIASRVNNGMNLSDDAIHKENFIKFLSDSRDWAYSYIEDVQKILNNFIKEVKPEIEYLSEFKKDGSLHSYYYSIKKITEEYKKLKTLLPKEVNGE